MSAPDEVQQRLLIVEDDEVFGSVLAAAMDERGYTSTRLRMLDEALEHVSAGGCEYEFAVLDLNLHGAASLPLIQPLKTSCPEIRILILTGYASITTAVEAVKLGADEYLTKPADADQVERALLGPQNRACVEAPSQPMSVRRLEWEHLQRVLAECDGNISEAARQLNMHRRTLQRKLAKKPAER